MKQKIVIKVEMNCQKCRTKALKIAAEADGVDSMSLEGEDKTQVVVTGVQVDAVRLTSSLRKKVGHAVIVSIAEVKPDDKQKEKEKEKEKENETKIVPINYCYDYQPYWRYHYYY